MGRNNLSAIQQCLSIAHCVPGTVLGTGPVFSALRRGIRLMGSRALAFICNPKEMDLPYVWTAGICLASLPGALAGTPLRQHCMAETLLEAMRPCQS